MGKTAKTLPAPSEEFKVAVIHSGSVSILCELCGRQYFSSEMLHTGDEEDARYYEEYQKLAKKKPDKYVEVSDSISWGNMDGKQAVVDCKCGKLIKYENFIWANRFVIAKYLKARSQKEAATASRQAKALSDVLVE